MRSICGLLIGLCVSGLVYAGLPISKQATIIDATSSSEILMEATGFYESSKKSKWAKRRRARAVGIQRATLDARKAAVYHLLFNGTDPILSTDEEKKAFEAIQSTFFDDGSISTFITYEDALPRQKVYSKKQTNVRVVIQIKVDKGAIIKALESAGVIIQKDVLTDMIGNPFIMVLPVVEPGQDPATVLKTDKRAQHGAGVIQSFLTAKQYDVLLPNQQAFLTDLSANQLALKQTGPADVSYQLALSVGSDMYIDFNISQTSAGYGTQKQAVTIRAFETTTGRLLGTETGYSEARTGEPFVSIEEAMLAAMTNVLSRVQNYWKADIKEGIQYKLVVSLDPSLVPQQSESIQDGLIDIVDRISLKTKEVASTDQTLDYVLWIDPNTYESSRKVSRAIRRAYQSAGLPGTVSLVNQNRKFVILSVNP